MFGVRGDPSLDAAANELSSKLLYYFESDFGGLFIRHDFIVTGGLAVTVYADLVAVRKLNLFESLLKASACDHVLCVGQKALVTGELLS